MPLDQVSSLAAPESRLLTVQPWDTSVMAEIEKAILKSDLGLNPVNDGKNIRLPIPDLTTERRKDLVKMVKKMEEEAKVALRNVRREANEDFKEMKKGKSWPKTTPTGARMKSRRSPMNTPRKWKSRQPKKKRRSCPFKGPEDRLD